MHVLICFSCKSFFGGLLQFSLGRLSKAMCLFLGIIERWASYKMRCPHFLNNLSPYNGCWNIIFVLCELYNTWHLDVVCSTCGKIQIIVFWIENLPWEARMAMYNLLSLGFQRQHFFSLRRAFIRFTSKIKGDRSTLLGSKMCLGRMEMSGITRLHQSWTKIVGAVLHHACTCMGCV